MAGGSLLHGIPMPKRGLKKLLGKMENLKRWTSCYEKCNTSDPILEGFQLPTSNFATPLSDAR